MSEPKLKSRVELPQPVPQQETLDQELLELLNDKEEYLWG